MNLESFCQGCKWCLRLAGRHYYYRPLGCQVGLHSTEAHFISLCLAHYLKHKERDHNHCGSKMYKIQGGLVGVKPWRYLGGGGVSWFGLANKKKSTAKFCLLALHLDWPISNFRFESTCVSDSLLLIYLYTGTGVWISEHSEINGTDINQIVKS